MKTTHDGHPRRRLQGLRSSAVRTYTLQIFFSAQNLSCMVLCHAYLICASAGCESGNLQSSAFFFLSRAAWVHRCGSSFYPGHRNSGSRENNTDATAKGDPHTSTHDYANIPYPTSSPTFTQPVVTRTTQSVKGCPR